MTINDGRIAKKDNISLNFEIIDKYIDYNK